MTIDFHNLASLTPARLGLDAFAITVGIGSAICIVRVGWILFWQWAGELFDKRRGVGS